MSGRAIILLGIAWTVGFAVHIHVKRIEARELRSRQAHLRRLRAARAAEETPLMAALGSITPERWAQYDAEQARRALIAAARREGYRP
jgi:hypothetical protein